MVLHSLSKKFQRSSTTFITFQDLCLQQKLLEYMSVHNNDASESLQPSWGKMCTFMVSSQLPGEVVYTTLLSMVCVKYSSYMRRIVVDLLQVPPNGYSTRPKDMIQYRSSSICYGWLLLRLPCFLSIVLILLLLRSYIRVQNLLKIWMLVWGKLIQKLRQKGV
ncbi:hypothetical protein Tco_1111913 [Tanacetum coccineum]|uniref:Uncharacterized protein n=1 Tax=Tanacetum coccineum TaxID=301880 RepID=A0ABQ5IMZ2_9ASTR